MASSAIRIKNAGTGSSKPAADEVNPLVRRVSQVQCYATAQILAKNATVEGCANAGIPVFASGGELSILIFDPEDRIFYDFYVWWMDRYPNDWAGYTRVYDTVISLLPSGVAPGYYVACLPWLAGDVVLHKEETGQLVLTPGGSCKLHIYRKWLQFIDLQPFTVSCKFENLEFSIIGKNLLSVYIERPSSLATRWSHYDPSYTEAAILSSAREYVDKDALHYHSSAGISVEQPWPEYSQENPVTGLVPTYNSVIGKGMPVIPLTCDSSLVYLATPETWEGHFNSLNQGDYYAEPYAVWEDFNPKDAASIVSSRTPYNPLPTPDEETGPYLLGRYRDEEGKVSCIRLATYTNIAAPTVICQMPIVCPMSEGNYKAWGEMMPAYITPDYISKILSLYRAFAETATSQGGNTGPELVVTINTGSGGTPVSDSDVATVHFAADGYSLLIEPVGDAPEVEVVSMSGGVVTLKVPYGHLVEKDSAGNCYAFQTIKLRYVLLLDNTTPSSLTLYPQTAGLEDIVTPPSGHPGIYEGYN